MSQIWCHDQDCELLYDEKHCVKGKQNCELLHDEI